MFALESDPPAEFERRPLSAEALAAVLGTGHRLARGSEPIPVAKLDGEAPISFGPGSSVRAVVDAALAAAGAHPRIAREGNHFDRPIAGGFMGLQHR